MMMMMMMMMMMSWHALNEGKVKEPEPQEAGEMSHDSKDRMMQIEEKDL